VGAVQGVVRKGFTATELNEVCHLYHLPFYTLK
jgi:hypothetical protein